MSHHTFSFPALLVLTALAFVLGFVLASLAGCSPAQAETFVEVVVVESTIGYEACPDLEFVKRGYVDFFEWPPKRPQTEEEMYQHHCHTFNSVNNPGLEVITNEGSFIKIRPCGWAESFWMSTPKEHIKLISGCPK